MSNIKYFLFIVIYFLLPSAGIGCPAFLDIDNLNTNQNIEEYSLFYYEKGNWVKVEYDVEKVDSLNQIQFKYEKKDNNKIKNNEDKNNSTNFKYRIVLDSNLGGNKFIYKKDGNDIDQSQNQFPCNELENLYEIKTETNKYFYLMSCKNDYSYDVSSLNIKKTIDYDKGKNLVWSPLYRYIHYPNNHVIFKGIEVHAGDNTLQLATDNASLNVYLDIKYFFSLELKSDSIFSKVKSWFFYPTRTLTDLIFYWKVLFMNVDINMGSTVSFYRDSVYIPFRLNVPVEARNYLNSHSGTMYSWSVKDIINYDTSGKTIPIFNIKDIEENTLVDTGLKYCTGNICKFSLNGKGPEFGFSSYFVMERSMVEKGFFPYLVLDEAQVRKDLGWDSNLNEKLKNRIGIYLNISNMRKGNYYWDMWIDMKKDSYMNYSSSVCPKKVEIKKIGI